MWESILSISRFSWFFQPSSSTNTTANSLDFIKQIIQELSRPKPRSILKRKITAESWPSSMWGNLLYLFSSLRMRFLSPSISNISQLKDLLAQEQVEKKTFIEYASNVFGQRLIKTVQKAIDSLPSLVKKKDLWHLFAMIGHKLTLNDLKDLLRRVNRGEIPLTLSRSLSNDIHELPSQDMKKLVGFFRNPLEHLLPNEKKILWEELEKSGIPLNTGILANAEYEYHIRKLAGSFEEEEEFTETDLKLLPFAITEQLARIVAYAQPDTICENMVIPILVFTEQQDIVYYQLNNRINEKGLNCYLFTPLKGNFPAQLVFRGTDDTESLIRDLLDLKGIGKTVFDECKNKIAEMIENYCRTTQNPALEIIGHSLGGADAQRATILCLELFNQENNNGPISRLSRINCSAFCSPKLDQDTIKTWEEQIDKLKNHRSPPQIRLNFAYHKKDLLTQVGFKNLLAKENLEFLEENHLQIASDSGIFATNTHHREPFFKGGKFYPSTDNRKYIHYNSSVFAQLKEKIRILQEYIKKEPEASFSEEELEVIELSKQNLVKMEKNKEEIRSCQEGYSSDSSWGIFFAHKLLIAPGQRFSHWIKSYCSYQGSSEKAFFAHELLITSRQRFSCWVKSHWIKV